MLRNAVDVDTLRLTDVPGTAYADHGPYGLGRTGPGDHSHSRPRDGCFSVDMPWTWCGGHAAERAELLTGAVRLIPSVYFCKSDFKDSSYFVFRGYN